MKKAVSLSLILLLAIAAAAQKQSRSDAQAAALLQADREFAKASEATNAKEAFATYLADDAIQLPAGANPLVGKEAILAEMGGSYVLKWEPKRAEVAKSGELGWTWGTYELHMKDADENPVVRYGKYVNVWRKQKNGKWKVIVDLGNPSPPPAGAPR